MTLYSFAIAVNAEGTAGLDNLESLTVPVRPPRPWFRGDSARADLGDGGQRSMGLPQAEWRWDIISQAERDQLREYCEGASAWVYITTLTNEVDDNSSYYKTYHAVMIWPEEEEVDAGSRLGFSIRFRAMTEATIEEPPS